MQHFLWTAFCFFLIALALVLGWWPLAACGVSLLSLSGRIPSALAAGVALDVLYGPPVGHWHALLFPFALLALACAAVHLFGKRFFFDSSARETL